MSPLFLYRICERESGKQNTDQKSGKIEYKREIDDKWTNVATTTYIRVTQISRLLEQLYGLPEILGNSVTAIVTPSQVVNSLKAVRPHKERVTEQEKKESERNRNKKKI